MRQVELMQIASGMKKGQAYQLTHDEMRRCAEGMLRSYLDGPVRKEDIDDFIAASSRNWGVIFNPNAESTAWTMYKVAE